ncbi:multidrug ABC transporter permease [Psychromonas marina]|uniref:Multidrug ABC transporter permease n=1 Tax=Psychromonas marina TaxID=88364 RepID=A0ABQ6E3F5_9GAMM|nr:ABC transporter permease [Psychromonas marina]GLS91730.1 multidrug ABC transporter permease [Psychromonas marina]
MMTATKLPQWGLLKSDRWLLSSLTWIPILLALSIWWVFSQGIAKDLPVGVVDLQQSALSRQLVREFDATSTLKVDHTFNDVGAAKSAFISNEIYAYIVIPKNFDRDIKISNAPQVTVFYNSQYILVGKLINSAALQAHGTFNAQIATLKQMAKGNSNQLAAISKAVRIRTQITPLFNKNSNYAQFLVSAIVPALWQISIVVSTILFLTANYRRYGLKKMVGKNPLSQLISISSFYLPFFIMQGASFLIWFYYILNWPMEGSLLPLFFAQLVTVIACMVMGALFFFYALDPAKAMSFAGAFSAPSFAFMGVTFPVTDMNMVAQVWRSLLPISHYIEAQISQVSYGASAWQTVSDFMPSMLGYLLPLLLTLLLIKKQLRKLENNNGSI